MLRLFAVLLAQVATFAPVPTAIAPVPPIASIPYVFNNSVIDHNGHLIIFDTTYMYPPMAAGPLQAMPVRFPPTIKTRVTIVGNDPTPKRDADFDGSFQVIGVGRYAVYAIVNNYAPLAVATATAAPIVPSLTRRLVALGPLFPTVPSMDLSFQTDVKVSLVGDVSAPDSIALIDTPAVNTHTVQLFQFDGKDFTHVPVPPIKVP
jgi:hypothetical protein